MKIQNNSLVITLKKIDTGYIFESLGDFAPSTNPKSFPKKSNKGRKPLNLQHNPSQTQPPTATRLANRLIKQIGISNEQIISQITPEIHHQPHQAKQLDQAQQNAQIQQQIHINEQEQVSCEIDRQTILPELPAFQINRENIHEIQKKQLKEYFIGKEGKTPEIYLKYRNFIVDVYQRNPKRYLSKIACRKMLRGDVNSIMRIHTFLENKRIINFGVDYEGNYNFKSNSLFKQSEQKVIPQSCLKSLPENDQETSQKQIDVDNMTITPINKNFSRSYRANCSICKLVCGVSWFANVTDDQSNLNAQSTHNVCYECFQQIPKQEIKKYQKVDIIKSMQTHSRQGKGFLKQAWSVDENLKLLDFMSNPENKNWKALLENLGGKRTLEDVILQFLQFPVSNVEIVKLKKDFQEQIRKNKQEVYEIGFNNQDYFLILQNFYESSCYFIHPQVKQKIQQPILPCKKQVQNSISGIKSVISLINEKTITKINILKQKQKSIESQIIRLESLFKQKKNIHTLRQDQPVYEVKKISREESEEYNDDELMGSQKKNSVIEEFGQEEEEIRNNLKDFILMN